MSIGKQLSQRFEQEKEQTSKNIQKQTQTVSELMGITAHNMISIIESDIKTLIAKGFNRELEGYVLSLSRIVKHQLAWECIQHAFKQVNETIPKKYYILFGQEQGSNK